MGGGRDIGTVALALVVASTVFFPGPSFDLWEGTTRIFVTLFFDVTDAVQTRHTQVENDPESWLRN